MMSTTALTIRDQLRYAHYTASSASPSRSSPTRRCGGRGPAIQLVAPGTPLGSLNVSRNQLYGTSLETFIENQTDATSKFNTSFIKHTLVTGVEIGEETSDPRRFTTIGPYSTTPLTNPNSGQPYNASTFYARNTKTDARDARRSMPSIRRSSAISGRSWAAVRLDRFDVNFYQQSFNNPVTGTGAGYTALQHKDDMASWRGGIVYKPLPIGSIYFDAGTSFDPSAEALSLQASTANLAPVKNKTYELGTQMGPLP